MSDIIKDAKQLLEEATPGPWSLDDSFDPGYPALHGAPQEENGIIRTPILSHDISDDFDPGDAELIAAAPELAQALAEETWEYAVQVHREGRWQFYIGESRLPTDRPGLANGFSQKNHAQEFAKLEGEYPARIVRRRVSPVEVINE